MRPIKSKLLCRATTTISQNTSEADDHGTCVRGPGCSPAFSRHFLTTRRRSLSLTYAFGVFVLQLLDACLAPDTSGDGSGCDNMTIIIVLFSSSSSTTENENDKKRKIVDEKPDNDIAEKRCKSNES